MVHESPGRAGKSRFGVLQGAVTGARAAVPAALLTETGGSLNSASVCVATVHRWNHPKERCGAVVERGVTTAATRGIRAGAPWRRQWRGSFRKRGERCGDPESILAPEGSDAGGS
jgi:hypothetical protein